MENPSEEKKPGILAKTFIIIGVGILLGIGMSGIYQIITIINGTNNSNVVIQAPIIDETDPAIVNDTSGLIDSDNESVIKAIQKVDDSIKVSTSDYSGLVDAVMPAVVKIECETTVDYMTFFGTTETYKSKSGGTGFFVTQDRSKIYIATNNHVVENADSIKITLNNSTEVLAETVGTDKYYDLAVISINRSDLSEKDFDAIRIANLGSSDSSNLSVGSVAIAIGNALGYGQSTTVGYISALNRTVTIEGNTKELIQTDAAINPGNSGGPLLNTYGQVIGINSVKYASSEVEGIGYAIPIDEAVPVINDLISSETLQESEMGYLGIKGKDISESYSEGFKMPIGVYISEIEENSAASESDLKPGDIITKVNGRSVKTMAELVERLNRIRAGEPVKITACTLIGGSYVPREITIILKNRPSK